MKTHYGKRRVPRLIKEVDNHRTLVRREGSPAIQESWDRIEEFVDFLFGEVAAQDNAAASAPPPDTESETR